MKKTRIYLSSFAIITSFFLSACSQDETMNEILENEEISSPFDPKDGSDDDKPGTLIGNN